MPLLPKPGGRTWIGVPRYSVTCSWAGNNLLHLCHTSQPPPMAAPETRFGFVTFAETWNGRLAMMGFVIGLATELLTGQGILSQIGLG